MKRLSALLVVLAIALPAYPFGQNKIVYDKFDWKIYHSTHFDVYFYDEEKAQLQRVVDAAESAYDDLSRKFNFQITKKIPLIFYATHSAFEQTNVELGFISEGYGAFAEPVKNRMVLPVDMPDEKLLQLIKHELTHIFEYELLFQGKITKQITANPPTWFMEGLASFMAEDEDSKDRMVLRDAVVNDNIPSITRNPTGYFAYRFGHSVFRYMQQKYGWEGVRDFIYEYRNTLGNSVDRALKRAFEVTPEEFDTQFRTWMRKQYLPALVEKGEPIEYGEPFRINPEIQSAEISAVPSPSGDLLAGFTTYKNDVDIAVFRMTDRKMWRNLTSGYTSRYEYPIVQSFTTAPVMGRDIAFSPNGDQIALFVKKERGRNLLLLNALTGDIEKSVPFDVEQQLSPTYSPDGTKIAFSGFRGNRSDIFTYEIATGKVENVTNDEFFDGAPVYSPDGKWLVYSSIADGYAKLFRLNVANPTERYQLTTGKWNDIDAWFSPDGTRVFFASDKLTGRATELPPPNPEAGVVAQAAAQVAYVPPSNFAAYNIYSLDLRNGDLLQYTDVVGGTFTPLVVPGPNGKERLVFSSYYKGQWRLFLAGTDKPVREAEKTTLPSEPMLAGSRPAFVPPVEVAIDEEKIDEASSYRLFMENVSLNAGVTSDRLFVSRSILSFSNMLGDRRFIAALDSVSSFSNFDFLYWDLRRRWNWGVRVFDNRSFYNAFGGDGSFLERGQQEYRQTGAMGIYSYPFTRYHRLDTAVGFLSRDFTFPTGITQNDDGSFKYELARYQDKFPFTQASFSGDSTVYREFGPIAGRKYQVTAGYAPDVDNGGTLSADYTLEWREYKQLAGRSLLAARVFGGYSHGNLSNFYYFGGLNTLRGYDYRALIGSQAAYANIELRFPLVDVIAFPGFAIQGIRGNLFFDIGAAKFPDQPFTFMEGGRLVDGKASVGYGFSFNMFGLELHWDFAKRYDLKDASGKFRTSFWIGETF